MLLLPPFPASSAAGWTSRAQPSLAGQPNPPDPDALVTSPCDCFYAPWAFFGKLPWPEFAQVTTVISGHTLNAGCFIGPSGLMWSELIVNNTHLGTSDLNGLYGPHDLGTSLVIGTWSANQYPSTTACEGTPSAQGGNISLLVDVGKPTFPRPFYLRVVIAFISSLSAVFATQEFSPGYRTITNAITGPTGVFGFGGIATVVSAAPILDGRCLPRL